MHYLSYVRLIQFHLSDLHTSGAHQVIAGLGQLCYLTMFRTSGRFVNHLWDKSVMIGKETVCQLASKINNFSMTKICIPALPYNVYVHKSNLHCTHLGLQKFRTSMAI